MNTEIRRRRGLNYLGELGSKLRDLRGTATLAHELIQNAEDAIKDIHAPSLEQATISFRIDQKALIVDNGGVFSDCGHQDEGLCPWKMEGRRPCDFHSFADVGGAAKRRASNERGHSGGLKGAFGFGFTAVYQVTDHPQLISNGRHWILEDHKPEDQRILECTRPDCEHCSSSELPGTRFVLPWAFDESSEVRLGLNAPIVSAEKPHELVKELEAALPRTVLFLDHIRQLRVFWTEQERMSVNVSDRSQPVITVSTNGEAVQWALLSYDFADVAEPLRMQHPEGEKVPSSEVKIAVPQSASSDGLFFAYLPTQDPTGVPFHINADFFPSNDRKRLLLEDDYQGEWNKAAIRAGAIALRNGLLSLRSHLGAQGFWDLVDKVSQVAEHGSYLGTDYWTEILPVLKSESVVPASDGSWYPASSVRFVSQNDHGRFQQLYHNLGIKTVDAQLEEHRLLITSADIGVRELDLGTLASRLVSSSVTGERSLDDLPHWMRDSSDRELLWSLIGELLGRPSHDDDMLSQFDRCAVVECTDGVFRTAASCFTADAETVDLFQALCPSLHFAKDDPVMNAALGAVIPEFTVEDAIDALVSRQAMYELLQDDENRAVPAEMSGRCLTWFNEHIDEMRAAPVLVSKMKSLAMCPTGDGLQPFTTVVLPGGFEDPIGVTSVADKEALRPVWPLVQLLQLDSLSLSEYVNERLPDAFQEYDFEADTCQQLLTMLAQHQGELYGAVNEDSVRNTLSGLQFVPCSDGELRCVDDGLYFVEDLTKNILGNSVNYVAESVCTSGIARLLTWLGVESSPRLDRVIDYMIELAGSASSPTQQLTEQVQLLFEHVAGRSDELEGNDRLREKLKSGKWLPATTRRWDSDNQKWRSTGLQWAMPGDLHHHRWRPLVESVASFARFPAKVQSTYRGVLKSLGMVDRPNAKTVIKHLRESARTGSPIDSRVYDFLNNALKDSELYPADFRGLISSPCLYDGENGRFVRPSECFSEEHPFGRFRVLLGSHDLTNLEELLDALEIRKLPTWHDAVAVLDEVSRSEEARLKKKLTTEDRRTVTECWKLIEKALRDDEISTEDVCSKLNELSKNQVVCRADNLLEKPANVFFRDREQLAEAFSGSLDAELIRMPQGATEALTQAGVRRLSEVTEIRVDHAGADKNHAEFVASRIRERAELLVNVVETCRPVSQKTAVPDFTALSVFEATTLTVELIFKGFERPLPPVRDDTVVATVERPSTLWYCLEDGIHPWDAIACELARLCLDSDDVAKLSAGFNAALEPKSPYKAQRKLNQLGFPLMEIITDVPEPTGPSTSFGLQSSMSGDADDLQLDDIPASAAPVVVGNVPPTPVAQLGAQTTSSAGGSPASRNESNGTSQNTGSTSHRPPAADASSVLDQLIASVNPTPEVHDDDDRFDDWLSSQSGGTDRRKQKIQQQSSTEQRRTSEYLLRRQRVGRVPKEEVFQYLSDLYSFDGTLMCQMRTEAEDDLHSMPFFKKDSEMYWGKEELFNRELTKDLSQELPEDARLNLFLCPTCAAIYTEFIGTQPRQQRNLLRWVMSDSDRTAFEVDCSLNGQQARRFIHFHPKHLDDIRSVDGVAECSLFSEQPHLE